MAMPEQPLWKTSQVAEALGLSISTVKRLVDTGELRAARTVGRHRLIPPTEALRFARQRNLPLDRLQALLVSEELAPEPLPGPTARVRVAEGTVDALDQALRRGRADEVRQILLNAYAACGSAAELGDHLIRPAMTRVGHEWQGGNLDVYQEHRASRLVETVLMDLISRLSRSQALDRDRDSAPLAIGASPEGDTYTISGLLCELALRELGWDVMNLGSNLPLPSLSRAVSTHRPRLVWLSASHLDNPQQFIRDYADFHRVASQAGTAVILGGQALATELRAELLAASFGERLAHLVEFARRLSPTQAANVLSMPEPPSRRRDGSSAG